MINIFSNRWRSRHRFWNKRRSKPQLKPRPKPLPKPPAVNIAETLTTRGLWISNPSEVGPGVSLSFEAPVRIAKTLILSNVKVGAYTFFRGGRIASLTEIGRYCSVAQGVIIGEGEHPLTYLSTHQFQYDKRAFDFWPEFRMFTGNTAGAMHGMKKPPEIGHDVWIGTEVTILRGVKIGHGAVIAAGAVVTKNVEPYMIVGGIPAKPIRCRFKPEVVERLLKLQWWDYRLESLSNVTFPDITKAIDQIESRLEKGLLVPIEPKIEIFKGGDDDILSAKVNAP